MRVVILIRGELVLEIRGSVYIKGCSEDFCIFYFLSILDTLSLVHGSCDLFDIHCTYIFLYIDVCYSPIFPCVVSFLSLYTSFLNCMQFIISVSH